MNVKQERIIVGLKKNASTHTGPIDVSMSRVQNHITFALEASRFLTQKFLTQTTKLKKLNLWKK